MFCGINLIWEWQVKHLFTKFTLFWLCIFFYGNSSLAEGFAAGTLIKVAGGYAKIERFKARRLCCLL